MDIKQTLFKTSQKFKQKNIDNYNIEAEMLLSFVLEKSREYLFAYGEKKISLLNNIKLNFLIKKRLRGLSLPVIVGEKEFFGIKFLVNKNVLVPRPETETLVEVVLEKYSKLITKYSKSKIIDLGTGSGCIIISLIIELKKKLVKKCEFYALDISNKALRQAKKNAKEHKVYNDIKFIKSDLLDKLIKNKEDFGELTLITANLPYLTPNQIKNSPTIQKEPQIALVAGDDGLLYYKKLFKTLELFGIEKNQKIIIFCEIDETQKTGIIKITKEILKTNNIKIKKDLSGLDRLAIIEL